MGERMESVGNLAARKMRVWAAALALTVTGTAVLSGCTPGEDEKFAAICEKDLKDRLVAPSSYKRISITNADQVLSEEAFKAKLIADKVPEVWHTIRPQMMKEGKIKPTNHRIVLAYDSQNAFGTSVRGQSLCELYSEKGDIGSASPIYLTIDGQSNVDFIISRFKKS
jgi:hypothetical protein